MKVTKKMSMLIMEEPRNCQECPLTDLSSMSGDKLCLGAGGRWIETQNEGKKPEWCPLIAFEVEVEKKASPFANVNMFAKEVVDR